MSEDLSTAQRTPSPEPAPRAPVSERELAMWRELLPQLDKIFLHGYGIVSEIHA